MMIWLRSRFVARSRTYRSKSRVHFIDTPDHAPLMYTSVFFALGFSDRVRPAVRHVSCPAANASASEFHITSLTQKSSATLFASLHVLIHPSSLATAPVGWNHRLILFSFEKSLVNCETPDHTRKLSAANDGGKIMLHLIWYIVVGLIAGIKEDGGQVGLALFSRTVRRGSIPLVYLFGFSWDSKLIGLW